MKIFIDSAKLEEIQEAYSYGIVDGVTTNPSLIKKAVDAQKKKVNMTTYIKQILRTAKGTPVSLEVTEFKYEKMVKQAKTLYKKFNPVAKNVCIKIPVNPSFDENSSMDGIKAIRTLSKSRIPVNCTLIFTPEQSLMAAKAGAKFVSPFVGRIDDYIKARNRIKSSKKDYFPAYGWHEHGRILEDNGIISGIDLVKQTVEIFKQHKIKAKVLAASIRNIRQLRESALVGADIATIPFDVIKQSIVHYKTAEGMKKFTDDTIPEYVKITKEAKSS